MSDKNSNLKNILFAVLLLALLGSSFFGYKYYKETQAAKKAESVYIEEKSLAENELKAVQGQYERLLSENTSSQDEILAERERIAQLLDSIKNIEPDNELLEKLKKERNYFKNKFNALSKENKRLVAANKKLTLEKNQLNSKINSITTEKQATIKQTQIIEEKKQAIIEKNKELETAFKEAKRINISNITTNAVKIKSTNKVIKVTKAKRANGIEVCYDVSANTFTDPGQKELYIQVITPLKNVLSGGKYELQTNEGVLSFSKVSKFRYLNKSITICDFIEPNPDEELEEGTYMVNIFEGTNLIDSSVLRLK